jgi:hypothetical protein
LPSEVSSLDFLLARYRKTSVGEVQQLVKEHKTYEMAGLNPYYLVGDQIIQDRIEIDAIQILLSDKKVVPCD